MKALVKDSNLNLPELARQQSLYLPGLKDSFDDHFDDNSPVYHHYGGGKLQHLHHHVNSNSSENNNNTSTVHTPTSSGQSNTSTTTTNTSTVRKRHFLEMIILYSVSTIMVVVIGYYLIRERGYHNYLRFRPTGSFNLTQTSPLYYYYLSRIYYTNTSSTYNEHNVLHTLPSTSLSISAVDEIQHQPISIKTRLNYTILHSHQQSRIAMYLLALYNGVKIVEAPITETLQNAIHDCEREQKPSLINNQHSLELRFPMVLTGMDYLSKSTHIANDPRKALLRVLHDTTRSTNLELKLSSYPVFQTPLFYFLNSMFYTVVYCSYAPKGKEDWRSGLAYWKEIARIVTTYDTWKKNRGVDYMAPASHPKSGPNIFDPTSVNEFSRLTFLRTDYDFTGNSPKDIVVPYFAKPMERDLLHTFRTSKNNSSLDDMYASSKFMVFMGSDNPTGGLRSVMEQKFQQFAYPDILFTTENIPSIEYRNRLIHAEFCLSVRGDTASTSRLFSIIAAGCIPLIISDWLHLPFASIIDYSKFSIRFPESIVDNLQSMVEYLRNVSPEQRKALREGVEEAKELLLYEQSDHQISLLNPITLTLIEFIQRREKYCNDFQDMKVSPMCEKMKRRLNLAQQILSSPAGKVFN